MVSAGNLRLSNNCRNTQRHSAPTAQNRDVNDVIFVIPYAKVPAIYEGWITRPAIIEDAQPMGRLFKLLFFLLILGAAAFVAYAYVGPIFMRADFEPPTERIVQPVTLEIE